MKVIESMAIIVLDIMFVIVIAFGIYMLNATYNMASRYSELSTTERNILYVFDNDRYNTLKESYEFISGLPFIGDTL